MAQFYLRGSAKCVLAPQEAGEAFRPFVRREDTPALPDLNDFAPHVYLHGAGFLLCQKLRLAGTLALPEKSPLLHLTAYAMDCIYNLVNTISIYKCLCDYQRLRILNLLQAGPLCVCHIMEILETDQVRTSKQLRYMRELGMVSAKREAQWMVYRLAEPSHPLLTENLKCLQDCVSEEIDFARDSAKRDRLVARLEASDCCPSIENENQMKS